MGSEIFSPYLITIFIAWLGSHIIKYLIDLTKNKKRKLRSHLYDSGGMPSSHSATAVSLATIIGLRDGFGSGLFGIAVIFALIVMYDATKVRRSAGEQGIAISEMIEKLKISVKPPRIAKGHTPLEVIMGSILGVIIGIVVFLATK
jgi:acid phosphatase family membrane protein YuiD